MATLWRSEGGGWWVGKVQALKLPSSQAVEAWGEGARIRVEAPLGA